MRKELFKKIEVIQGTSGDQSTIQAQVKELKTKLYDDLASLKEVKNPKPAETKEDSNDDEMSGAQEEQSHDKLEPADKPNDEKLPASAEPQVASMKHPKEDQDDDDVLDAHSKDEGYNYSLMPMLFRTSVRSEVGPRRRGSRKS